MSKFNMGDENTRANPDHRIEFDTIVHHTPQATLFRDGDEQFWLPKEHIDVDEDNMMVYAPHWVEVKRMKVSNGKRF